MGNCQAIDAAAMVIQHPNGKIERLYWPISAHEIMKLNPGHYVSLVIPLPISGEQTTVSGDFSGDDKAKSVHYTRVKLLRPTDTLVLGRAYRLVTSQEVKKVLRAKKQAKTKMNDIVSETDKLQMSEGKGKHGKRVESDKNDKVLRNERQKLRTGSMNSTSKSWRPSLKSISEADT